MRGDQGRAVPGRWRAGTTLTACSVLLLASFFPWASLNNALSVAGIRVFEGRSCLLLAVVGAAFSGWRILRPGSKLFLMSGVAGALATVLLVVFAIRAQFLASTLRTAFGVTGETARKQTGLDYGWYTALIAALVLAVIGLLDWYLNHRRAERERTQTPSAPSTTH